MLLSRLTRLLATEERARRRVTCLAEEPASVLLRLALVQAEALVGTQATESSAGLLSKGARRSVLAKQAALRVLLSPSKERRALPTKASGLWLLRPSKAPKSGAGLVLLVHAEPSGLTSERRRSLVAKARLLALALSRHDGAEEGVLALSLLPLLLSYPLWALLWSSLLPSEAVVEAQHLGRRQAVLLLSGHPNVVEFERHFVALVVLLGECLGLTAVVVAVELLQSWHTVPFHLWLDALVLLVEGRALPSHVLQLLPEAAAEAGLALVLLLGLLAERGAGSSGLEGRLVALSEEPAAGLGLLILTKEASATATKASACLILLAKRTAEAC